MTVTKIKQILLRLTAIAALSCYITQAQAANESIISSTPTKYNNLASAEWPNTGAWLDLSRSLSTFAELYGPFQPSDYNDQCTEEGKVDPTNPLEVAFAGEGICMQYPSCSNKFCLGPSSSAAAAADADADAARTSNLPAYVLEAQTEEDIIKGMQFANKNKIQVTVKSSGHSLMGASTAQDSLLIWLAKYPADNTIQLLYQDSCQVKDGFPIVIHDAVIGVAAGQNFKSIAEAVGDDYHFVSASEWTVSASGGFFQGGGISYTSRKYGLGVDNVVDLRVVLPSGAVVTADRCTNKDLFWALRGGGGGTFGVVTHMTYKLHPPTPIVRFQFNLGAYSNNATVVSSFLKYWAEVGPTLDARWGGRFTWFGLDLFFAGYQVGANLFVNDFMDWVQETLDNTDVVNRTSMTKLYSSWSALLPDMQEAAGESYIADTSFSRLVPLKFATNNVLQSYQLMESLAISRTLGYSNLLLGEAINDVSDDDTSVHPAMRESVFLLTTNKIGYETILKVLPNDITGSSKNHVGSLEPEWRKSIWGDQYERLLSIKSLVDPLNILNCYQSVGFIGQEADIYNVNSLPGQATNGPGTPQILQSSSGPSAVSVGIKSATFLAVMTTCALAIC